MKPTEENHSTESPREGYVKVPNGAYLYSLLIDLYAEQHGVIITYEIEDKEGRTLTLTTGKPFPGSKWTYKKAEEVKK